MNKIKEALHKIVEAGKSATKGEWHTVGLPWNVASPYVIAGHHDPHVGKAILDVIEPDSFEGETDEDIRIAEMEEAAEQQANCAFVCEVANARPILEEHLAALEKDGWQPIETAPKDGTEILGCVVGSRYKEVMSQIDVIECSIDPNDFSCAVFFWQHCEWLPSGYDCYGLTALPAIEFTPTHWMPLPEPPKGEGHE